MLFPIIIITVFSLHSTPLHSAQLSRILIKKAYLSSHKLNHPYLLEINRWCIPPIFSVAGIFLVF